MWRHAGVCVALLLLCPRARADMPCGFAQAGGDASPEHPTAGEAAEAYGRRAQAAGATIVRMEIAWRNTRDVAKNPRNDYVERVRRLRGLGLEVIPIIANGYSSQTGTSPDDRARFASPQAYVEAAAAHARELVRALAPLGVRRYQLENELNAAGLTTLPPYRWRSGRTWFDPAFKDALLGALVRAVKAEDPAARVLTNFHDALTDPADVLDRVLARWGPLLDEVGIDFYPNYVLPRPVLGGLLGARIEHYRRLTGKPVLVTESGYPSQGYGHDPWLQAEFVATAMDSARRAGAAAFLWLHLEDTWRGPPRRTLDPLQRIEPWWGLVDSCGEPKRGARWRLRGLRLVREERSAWEEFRRRARG